MTGVDTGEEWFDEAVDDRGPDAVGDEGAHGDVLDHPRPDLLSRRPDDLLRGEESGRGGRIGGYAHHRPAR